MLNVVAGRGAKANMASTALIGWKAGHPHWLLAHMGFWEGTFKWIVPGSKESVGSFPSPSAEVWQQWPMWSCEQSPGAQEHQETIEATYVYGTFGWVKRPLVQP